MSMTTEEMVARRVHLAEQIERLTQEKQQIDDKLREDLEFGTNPAGDWTVSLSHNRRLDAARFMQRFPVAQYPHFYTPTVDVKSVKDFIAPVELDSFYNEGAAIVKVK